MDTNSNSSTEQGPPKRFVVSRKKWLRGSRSSGFLAFPNGCKCVMGFVGRQCGVPARYMYNRGALSAMLASLTAAALSDYAEQLPAAVHPRYPYDAVLPVFEKLAIRYNDDPVMTDTQRERALIRLFAKHRMKLVFTD